MICSGLFSLNTHNAVCFSTTTLPPSLLGKQALRGGSHLILKLSWQMMYCFPQVQSGKLRPCKLCLELYIIKGMKTERVNGIEAGEYSHSLCFLDTTCLSKTNIRKEITFQD